MRASVLLPMSFLTACATSGPQGTMPVTLTPEMQQVAEERAMRDLRDPDSAQFRDVWAVLGLNSNTIYVCGELNDRNAFGGYVGYAPFVVELNSFGTAAYSADIAENRDYGYEMFVLFNPACHPSRRFRDDRGSMSFGANDPLAKFRAAPGGPIQAPQAPATQQPRDIRQLESQ